ncbi:MAG: transposase [Sphingobacteriales bacterium]|nr:MAG: transposase [Sphingobacteriales bacterium]
MYRKTKRGQGIERSEFTEVAAQKSERYQTQKARYRKRQEINEHIIGTIRQQWNYNYINLRGLKKVNGEHCLILLVYNIKRTINIPGVEELL